MRDHKLFVRLVAALPLILIMSGSAQQAVRPLPQVRENLDAYLLRFHEAHDFNGVVLLAHQDRVLFEKTYGSKTPNTSEHFSENTAFRIASLSKTFTAGAIEMLIEQGTVSLDDPLNKYLPKFPNGGQILIKHLLLHSSGVGQLVLNEPGCLSTDELVKRIALIPPLFAPGTSDRYSNEGYVLLAAVIEKASGTSYEEFLTRNIWKPLGMSHTGVMCRRWPVKDHATAAISGLDDGLAPLPQDAMGWDGPGSIYSTATDLYSWMQALAADRLMRYSALKYPYGWGKRDYSNHALIEQTGELGGFTAHIAFYPREKLFFVMLNCVESGFFNRTPKDIDHLLFGGATTVPPETQRTVSPAHIDQLAGDYLADSFPLPLRFVYRDKHLWLHWGDDPVLRPLVPTREGFFERAEYGSFRFEQTPAGKVLGVTAQFGDGDAINLKRRHSVSAGARQLIDE